MATNITRTPKNELSDWFGRGFDDLYEGFFRPMRVFNEEWNGKLPSLALDIVDNDKGYVITTEMPGVKKEDISITCENGVLSISGEKTDETSKTEKGKLVRRERSYGCYSRQLRLGADIDEKGIKASMEDGVLKLTVPKKAGVEAKRIKVEVH